MQGYMKGVPSRMIPGWVRTEYEKQTNLDLYERPCCHCGETLTLSLPMSDYLAPICPACLETVHGEQEIVEVKVELPEKQAELFKTIRWMQAERN